MAEDERPLTEQELQPPAELGPAQWTER